MKQPRNHSFDSLAAAGRYARAGAIAHGATLNLVWGSQVAIDGALNPLMIARDAHSGAMAEFEKRKRMLQTKKAAAYDLLFGSRDLLKRSLGKQYSTAWHGTGFVNSLEIPRSVPRLQMLAGTLKAYLTAHPALQRAELMTAEMLGAALTDLTNAQNAVTLQKSFLGATLTDRRRKEKALRLQLRWMVQELTRLIDPLDDRWTAFGFNKPGVQQTPPAPEKVTVELVENETGRVKWEKTPRAKYFRVWLKVKGVDEEMKSIGSPADLDFLLEHLPGNSVMELAVSAVNNGGESALSEVVIITTGDLAQ